MTYLPVLTTICGASQVLAFQHAEHRVPERIVIPVHGYDVITRRTFAFDHPFDPNATAPGLDATLAQRHPELRQAGDVYVCVFREAGTQQEDVYS